MTMNIKNPEAHQLATELAAMDGTSMTQAVLDALREQMRKRKKASREEKIRRLVAQLQEDFRNGPPLTTDDLYDPETGLPA